MGDKRDLNFTPSPSVPRIGELDSSVLAPCDPSIDDSFRIASWLHVTFSILESSFSPRAPQTSKIQRGLRVTPIPSPP